MKLNKLISALSAAVIAASGLAMLSASAASPENASDVLTDGIYTFELVSGSYTITKCDPTAITSEVPEFRNGYSVTAIADSAFVNCTMISELTIPTTVKSIGSHAFAGCTSLKKVTLPSRIDKISEGTFMGCSNLESVELPDKVEYIGSYAFYNCSKLTDVKLPNSLETISPMAFAECSSIENFDADGCDKFVYEDGFLMNSDRSSIYRASAKLTGDVYVPDSVKSIEPGSFSVCAGMENLFLPSSVSKIGDDAFGYCMSLKKIDFSSGLTEIADIAFKYCPSLETLELPTTLDSIGEGAFYSCSKLSRVTLPEGITKIGAGAFADCPELKRVIAPKSLDEIGDNAFGFTMKSDGEYEKLDDFSMSVYSDSKAAAYAKSSGIKYENMDTNIKGIAFAIVCGGILLAAAVFAVYLMKRGGKSASHDAKKAEKQAKKAAKEQEEEENYESILSDD